MKTPKLSERQLVSSLTVFLSGQGFKVKHEVSNMGQSIDMVATKNRWITAIEVKRRDWRRGLQQCRAHELIADFIVLAMKQYTVPVGLSNELKRNGWGLITMDAPAVSWHWRIEPKRNQQVWKPQRKRFTASMKKITQAINEVREKK